MRRNEYSGGKVNIQRNKATRVQARRCLRMRARADTVVAAAQQAIPSPCVIAAAFRLSASPPSPAGCSACPARFLSDHVRACAASSTDIGSTCISETRRQLPRRLRMQWRPANIWFLFHGASMARAVHLGAEERWACVEEFQVTARRMAAVCGA